VGQAQQQGAADWAASAWTGWWCGPPRGQRERASGRARPDPVRSRTRAGGGGVPASAGFQRGEEVRRGQRKGRRGGSGVRLQGSGLGRRSRAARRGGGRDGSGWPLAGSGTGRSAVAAVRASPCHGHGGSVLGLAEEKEPRVRGGRRERRRGKARREEGAHRCWSAAGRGQARAAAGGGSGSGRGRSSHGWLGSLVTWHAWERPIRIERCRSARVG